MEICITWKQKKKYWGHSVAFQDHGWCCEIWRKFRRVAGYIFIFVLLLFALRDEWSASSSSSGCLPGIYDSCLQAQTHFCAIESFLCTQHIMLSVWNGADICTRSSQCIHERTSFVVFKEKNDSENVNCQSKFGFWNCRRPPKNDSENVNCQSKFGFWNCRRPPGCIFKVFYRIGILVWPFKSERRRSTLLPCRAYELKKTLMTQDWCIPLSIIYLPRRQQFSTLLLLICSVAFREHAIYKTVLCDQRMRDPRLRDKTAFTYQERKATRGVPGKKYLRCFAHPIGQFEVFSRASSISQRLRMHASIRHVMRISDTLRA